jgi:hypothetical protein
VGRRLCDHVADVGNPGRAVLVTLGVWRRARSFPPESAPAANT